jgi:CRISPR-associated protein Cas1
MKRTYYVFSNGRLVRKQNTIYLYQYGEEREDDDAVSLKDAATQASCVMEQLEDDIKEENATDDEEEEADFSSRKVLSKRPVPIEDVEAFFIFGEMEFNTKLVNFLARHRVPVHFFNYFGFYSSTLFPRQEVNSGFLVVKQVDHYSRLRKRMLIARAFVEGASANILKNLRYYNSQSRGRDLMDVITAIEAHRANLEAANDIQTLMGIEGSIRALYYSAWPRIFSAPWAEFQKRVKRPPDNPVNALVSFGNSLCYTLALSEIYRTPLSPLISFLHEPGARRYSLSLDIAEIFKPIICDRLIFRLINNGEIRPQHFDEKLNFCYLKESGRKIFLQAWEDRLKQTIEHRNLGRKVSYRRLVRLECYKLEKHLMGITPYEPFKIWW